MTSRYEKQRIPIRRSVRGNGSTYNTPCSTSVVYDYLLAPLLTDNRSNRASKYVCIAAGRKWND